MKIQGKKERVKEREKGEEGREKGEGKKGKGKNHKTIKIKKKQYQKCLKKLRGGP